MNNTTLHKELTKEQIREIIAKRVSEEFKDNDTVTLGIGLPNEVAKYIPPSKNVIIQSENGVLGISGKDENGTKKIINSGGEPASIRKGGCFYDSIMAFTMMRGGHIDATVLGALQVDSFGNIASWQIPNKFIPGIGGSMDLVVGAKKVIIAMEHLSKGQKKIVKKCTLPLTAAKEADLIVTERAVFKFENDEMFLTEINPMFTLEDIKNSTDADFIISKDLKHFGN